MKPDVTIITVCLNPGEKLSATIRSVEAQIGASIQHLIIDGGSTDGTLRLLAQHPSTEVQSGPDAGIYDAMNKGLAIARGQVVYFLNAGDSLVGNSIVADAWAFFAEDPSCQFVYGDTIWAADGRQRRRRGRIGSRLELYVRGFDHQAVFARPSVYLDNGGFDLRFPTFADYHRLVEACVVRKIQPKRWNAPIAYFLDEGQDYRGKRAEKWAALSDIVPASHVAAAKATSSILAFLRKIRLLAH